ncbi:MAG: Fur family transcriptional regulator [Myxococcales bacterium]|nr:transcriptional repressor [Myxococcota bacterium]MDW8280460.1 Fur family transcriptional regulator [Myxococcales bacterium]
MPARHRSAGCAHDHDHEAQARALLRERDLRVTRPRLAVLTALLDLHRPASAQELIEAVAVRGLPGMDDVTVYRTVNTLVEHGIAQQVGTTDRGRRFEVHACDGCQIDHPHLQCRRCGRLDCLEQAILPTVVIPTELGGYLIDKARLYLYGLCAACRPPAPRKRKAGHK